MKSINAKKAYFVGGLRSPFGRAGKGALASVRPDDLMIQLIQAHQSRFPALHDQAPEDFLLGCAYPHGEQGFNLARMVTIGAKLEAPGATITRLCGSSLEAVATAVAKIKGDFAEKILVGGVESLSRVERRGAGFTESELVRSAHAEAYMQMGDTAEQVARRFTISRSEQENFAARSHELADQAYTQGFYKHQLWNEYLEKDESIRVPVDLEKMRQLKPAFQAEGTVTAATSSPLSDGACVGMVVAESQLKTLELDHGLQVIDVTVAHVAPEVMGLGPVPAVQKLLSRNNLKMSDIAAVEMNEAFAIQVLACQQELCIPLEKLNTKGGAIAIGHPLGASGLRLLQTLEHRLFEIGNTAAYGIACLCIGGGQGMAALCRVQKLS